MKRNLGNVYGLFVLFGLLAVGTVGCLNKNITLKTKPANPHSTTAEEKVEIPSSCATAQMADNDVCKILDAIARGEDPTPLVQTIVAQRSASRGVSDAWLTSLLLILMEFLTTGDTIKMAADLTVLVADLNTSSVATVTPSPTCTVTLDRTSIGQGETYRATLSVMGSVFSASITDVGHAITKTVSNSGGSVDITILSNATGQGEVKGEVTDASGSNYYCTANYTVIPEPAPATPASPVAITPALLSWITSYYNAYSSRGPSNVHVGCYQVDNQGMRKAFCHMYYADGFHTSEACWQDTTGSTGYQWYWWAAGAQQTYPYTGAGGC